MSKGDLSVQIESAFGTITEASCPSGVRRYCGKAEPKRVGLQRGILFQDTPSFAHLSFHGPPFSMIRAAIRCAELFRCATALKS